MTGQAVAHAANGTALADHGEALPGLLGDDGYTLPPALPFDRWKGIIATLRQIDRSAKWWLGDAIVYGERTYGEDASQAWPDGSPDAPYGSSAMRQAAWVSDRFPPNTRVTALSWTHHRAVAELDPDDRRALLQEALGEHLSTRDLIERVKDRQEAIRADALGARSEPAVCAADRPWPQLADLLPEWRRALEERAADKPAGYVQGWLDALVATGNEACFANWKDER